MYRSCLKPFLLSAVTIRLKPSARDHFWSSSLACKRVLTGPGEVKKTIIDRLKSGNFGYFIVGYWQKSNNAVTIAFA